MERLDAWGLGLIAFAVLGLGAVVIARLSVLLERCQSGALLPP
jgi:hypothetical protein